LIFVNTFFVCGAFLKDKGESSATGTYENRTLRMLFFDMLEEVLGLLSAAKPSAEDT